MVTFFCIMTLAIANVFVVQRVYALWAHSKRVLMIVCPVFVLVYVSTFISTAFAIVRLIPHIQYSPLLETCILDVTPRLFIASYAIPILFDIFLFALTCWNAFDRPRHMQTAIVKQLYLDGVVYFIALLTLRIFNIIVVAVAPIAYIQLGVYFIWSMIAAVINRMLITISTTLEESRETDPSGRGSPYGQFQTPFELSAVLSGDVLEEPYSSFMDMAFDPRAHALPTLPMPLAD